jgi:hypothetical protein
VAKFIVINKKQNDKPTYIGVEGTLTDVERMGYPLFDGTGEQDKYCMPYAPECTGAQFGKIIAHLNVSDDLS